jgi:hypothetical protein
LAGLFCFCPFKPADKGPSQPASQNAARSNQSHRRSALLMAPAFPCSENSGKMSRCPQNAAMTAPSKPGRLKKPAPRTVKNAIKSIIAGRKQSVSKAYLE